MHSSDMPRTTDLTAATPIRVPEITIYFWLVKILSTGAGESASDYLGKTYNHALVGVGCVAALALSLVLQFRMRRYLAWTYWFAVLMIAIVGTMAADVLHVGLHVSYTESTIGFAIILAIIFGVWYHREGTLSIHSITTRRRETLYWATVIATFALGTAAGDMTATSFGWGYLGSGIAFGIAIVVVGLAHPLIMRSLAKTSRARETVPVFTFGLAYILKRPLGASFADWFGKPPAQTGLGYGDGTVALIMTILIVLFVAFLAVTRLDVPEREDEERALAPEGAS
jgi:uncharacterized membrane-anchored protein